MDAFVMVIGANGNKGWVRRIGGDQEDKAEALHVDPNGNLYVVGTFQGQVNFAADWGRWAPKTSTAASDGGQFSKDVFITRIKKPTLSFVE